MTVEDVKAAEQLDCAIKLIASVMANAMIEGRQGEQTEEAAQETAE